MTKEAIGLKLFDLRNSKSISRTEMSKETKITERSIAAYERGERVPRDEVKIVLANYFSVSVQEIFFDEELHIS